MQDGSQPRICPQATPAWSFIARQFVIALVTGNVASFNYTQAQQQLAAYIASGAANTPPLPGTTEDCLFLDVHTPKAVFDNASKYQQQGSGGAPVLVW